MFLLVPAYPGCPGSKAVKRSLLLLLFVPYSMRSRVCATVWRPSVRLSVSSHAAAAGLLLWARLADRRRSSTGTVARLVAAGCGQCHVVSIRSGIWNTDLLQNAANAAPVLYSSDIAQVLRHKMSKSLFPVFVDILSKLILS